jgi:hypothetical protein
MEGVPSCHPGFSLCPAAWEDCQLAQLPHLMNRLLASLLAAIFFGVAAIGLGQTPATGYAVTFAKSRVYQGNVFSAVLTPTGSPGAQFAQGQTFTLTSSDGSAATVSPPPAGGAVSLPMLVSGSQTVTISSGGAFTDPASPCGVTVLPGLRSTSHIGAPPAGGDADNSAYGGNMMVQPVEGRAELVFMEGEQVGFHLPYQVYSVNNQVNAWEVYDFSGNLIESGTCNVGINSPTQSDTIFCPNVTLPGAYSLYLYNTTVPAGSVDFVDVSRFVVLNTSRSGLPYGILSMADQYNYNTVGGYFTLFSNATPTESEAPINTYTPIAGIRCIRRSFTWTPSASITDTLTCANGRVTINGVVTQPFNQFLQASGRQDLYTPVVQTFQGGTTYSVEVDNFNPGNGTLENIQMASGAALSGTFTSDVGTLGEISVYDYPAWPSDPGGNGDHNSSLRAYLGEAGAFQRYQVTNTSQPSDFAEVLPWETTLIRRNDPARENAKIFLSFTDLYTDYKAGMTLQTYSPSGAAAFINGLVAMGFSPSQLAIEFQNEPLDVAGGNAAEYGALVGPLYTAIESAQPQVTIIGYSATALDTQEEVYQSQVLAAAGGNGFLDAMSWHPYNTIEGDYADGQANLSAWDAWRSGSAFANMAEYQTEQGAEYVYHGTVYMRYSPRLALAQKLFLESDGVPAARDYYWAPVNNWQTDPTAYARNLNGSTTYSVYPVFSALRTWGDEIYGLAYSGTVNFGGDWNRRLFGSIYTAPDGSGMMAFSTNGAQGFSLPVTVAGGVASLAARQWDGKDLMIPVSNGAATLPLDEMMLYVRLPAGVTVTPNLPTLGMDLALAATLTSPQTGSGSLATLNDGSDVGTTRPINLPGVATLTTPTSQLDDEVDLNFGAAITFNQVHISCPFPFQSDGTLLDFVVQAWDGSNWNTVASVTQTVNGVPATAQIEGSRLDDYSDRAFLFLLSFNAVTASKARVLIYSASYGVSPTAVMAAYGGVDTPTTNQPTLREIAVYNAIAPGAPPPPLPVILTEPLSQAAELGTNVILSVIALGTGIQYQWLEDGVAIAGATAPTLNLPGISLSQQGTYSVVVTNDAGAVVSLPATVTVQLTYQDWTNLYLSNSGGDPSPYGDADGDGVPNLLQYVFGINPVAGLSTTDAAKLPQVSTEMINGVLYIDFTFNQSSHETATLSLEGSPDLSTNSWQAVVPDITETTTNPVTLDQTVCYKIAVSGPAQFFRLRASL